MILIASRKVCHWNLYKQIQQIIVRNDLCRSDPIKAQRGETRETPQDSSKAGFPHLIPCWLYLQISSVQLWKHIDQRVPPTSPGPVMALGTSTCRQVLQTYQFRVCLSTLPRKGVTDCSHPVTPGGQAVLPDTILAQLSSQRRPAS